MEDRAKQVLALGREYYEKQEYDRAEHYLKQVLESNRFADVLNMLGVISHDRGNFEDAQAFFEEALQINPNYTESALNLAVTYNDLGRYEDAKRIYGAALSRGERSPGKLDPFVKGKIANLHANVARAYEDIGHVSSAVEELRKAIALCPDFADLRMRLANLYRQTGDLKAAQYELEEATKARPGYQPARVALGVVKLAQGDKDTAKAVWDEVLSEDPDNTSAKMYRRLVDAGLSIAPDKKP